MARERLRPDHPWLSEYSNLLSERFITDNMEHHIRFVELVEELAHTAAAGRTPRLLEAGAGSAAFALAFSRRNFDVTAVDNDPLMVLRAQHIAGRLGGYVRILCMDLADLALLAPRSFDVVFSQGTFEHFDNDTIVAYLNQQLHVGCYVVFSVPSLFWPNRDFLNERKMTTDEWKVILERVDADLLHLSYYHKGDLHVLAALTRSQLTDVP